MVDFSKEQLQKIIEYSKQGYSEQVIANKLGVSKFDLEAFLTSAAEEHTRNSKTVEAITFREYLKFRDDDPV
ncbi:MAG: hypothetical protein LBV42_01895 [Methanobrevibacter sp.]|jgi:hypothetical protein|nr:hypothetical protein [Methanobrevibacter sp.]